MVNYKQVDIEYKKIKFLNFSSSSEKNAFLSTNKYLDCETHRRVSLEQKSYIKYLGVSIDQNLSWKNHVDSVIVKISKTIGMIAKLRYYVPSTVLVNIYNSLILPYITYGLLAWGNASNAYLNRFQFFKSEFCA